VVAVLVLISALLHSLWNALLKTEKDKDIAVTAMVCLTSAGAVVVAASVCAVAWASPFPQLGGLSWAVGAGLFEAAYFVLLVMALERAALATAYTISRGVAILAVWPLSISLLAEPVTPASIGGSAVLCVGLAVSGVGRGGGSAAGVALSILCGLSIAGYHLCYKQALAGTAQPTAVFAVAMGVAAAFSLLRLGRARFPALGTSLRLRPRLFALLSVTTAASFLLFLVALARGGAGFVLTLRNTSIVFTALIGWRLGERPSPAQLLGVALVAAGAMLVGLSG